MDIEKIKAELGKLFIHRTKMASEYWQTNYTLEDLVEDTLRITGQLPDRSIDYGDEVHIMCELCNNEVDGESRYCPAHGEAVNGKNV